MKKFATIFLSIVLFYPFNVGAFYTMDNFWSMPHEAPAWFLLDNNGGFYGETVGGTPFTQRPVFNEYAIKLHKFAIDDVFFYISDKGTFQAENDLKAISIYFSLV